MAYTPFLFENLAGFESDNLQIGNRGYGIPYMGSQGVGFRVARGQ